MYNDIMANNRSFSSISLLSLGLGVYFIVAGIFGLTSYFPTGPLAELQRGINDFFHADKNMTLLVISSLELVCGALLILAPLGVLRRGILNVAVFLVVIFWVVKSALELFVYRKPLEPTILSWLQDLALDLVMVLAVWQVRHIDHE